MRFALPPRRFIVACMVASTALLIAGSSPGASAADVSQPVRGGTLNFVVDPEPPTLVDLTNTAVPTLKVSTKVTEGLLTYDFALHPGPQLATSWSISPDGLQYTFHLRHGVKWHDGLDFTSADVAYSIELLKRVHPRGKSTFANVTEVRTPDAFTAVLVLSKPSPFLIKAFSASESPIVPKHVYEGTDPFSNQNNNAPIGTGPFRFVKWVRGSYIEYERNPDYWDKPKPYLDKIIVKLIPDAPARSIAFETGSVDLGGNTPIPLSDIARLKQNPKLGIETRGYEFEAGVVRVEFNLSNQYLKVPAVRQAIARAIDRNVIAKTIYYGYASVLSSPIIPEGPYHDPTPTPYPFDVAKANALLDAAGLPRNTDGVRFSVIVDPLPISDIPQRTAAYLRSALAKIGVSVTIRNQDLPSYLRRVYSDHDFDIAVNGMSNLFDPTVGVQRLYWSQSIRKGVPFTNASGYSNPEVDRLLEQAAVEPNEAKRKQLFGQFQQIVGRDLPDVNLVEQQQVTIYNKRVHNHTTSPDGLDSNFSDVYLSP
jgi:peptide/nickel transport system substrate-binding protein